MRLAHLRLALFASLAAAPAAQVPPARVAPPHVAVTVVDASDAPIADATVTLYGPTLQNGSLSMRTDDHGTFSFRWLAPGGYRIGATKDGFVPVQEGQRDYRYAGRRFTLRAGEHREVRLRLPRLGVVTGRVVDERGHPMVDATVRALEISMASGYRRLLIKAEARTDGRGVYRLHSLWPAGYLVCASAAGTAPLDDAQRLQLQVDRARQSAGLATGPAAAAAAERLAALEAQLRLASNLCVGTRRPAIAPRPGRARRSQSVPARSARRGISGWRTPGWPASKARSPGWRWVRIRTP